MRLGECKAPGEVTRGFRLARVDHGAVSLCGSGSSAERGVWPWTREGSMGVDGRGSAGGFDRRRQSGARAVHAAHRKSGGPVARGRGGGLTERGRPLDGRGYTSTGQDEAHYDLGQATLCPCFRSRAPSALGQSASKHGAS
jgi:hypothetical protein